MFYFWVENVGYKLHCRVKQQVTLPNQHGKCTEPCNVKHKHWQGLLLQDNSC